MRRLAAFLFLTSIGATLLTAGGAHAADPGEPGLVTDRPGFTDSAVLVPAGRVQLEGGLTWDKVDEDATVISGPEALVRWGVGSRLELRFGLPDYVDLRNGVEQSGLADASLGAKVRLGPSPKGCDIAAVVTVSLPTGDDEFTSDEVDPGLLLAVGRPLAPDWTLGVQLMADWPTVAGERELVWGGTLALGTTLAERWGGFLELAFAKPEEGDEPVVLHNGYTYALGPNAQLDFHAGVGLSDTASEAFFGAGFAVRR